MDDINSTISSIISMEDIINMTITESPSEIPKTNARMFSVVLKVVYAIGIIGNGVAIVALRTGERRVRNRKHLLLLTSLAANDFIALLGMMGAMVVAEHFPIVRETQVYCAARVVLRVFGIGSVCIAVTMALERFLALTRPFMYQKQVTYYVIRMTLLVSYFWVALMTCAPIFGLGLYYNEEKLTCVRYREARTNIDFAYGIFYVVFGTFLCVILVYCNLAVIQALYAITAPRNGGQPVVRRVSKSSCRQRQRSLNAGSGHNLSFTHNAATAEEVAFSRLMATLSVFFMICWLPQMITSALYLALGPSWWDGRFLTLLTKLSDLLMLLNYVLDPILYVLMRQKRRLSVTGLGHSVAHCFKRNHKTSTESMKTSCCPDTMVVSDSSGAELRPLRALPPGPPICATILKIDD